MYVTVCGKIIPDEGIVAGYDNRIWDNLPAKQGVYLAESLFQTRSNSKDYLFYKNLINQMQIYFAATLSNSSVIS